MEVFDQLAATVHQPIRQQLGVGVDGRSGTVFSWPLRDLADGPAAGGRLIDAAASHPTQFDAFEIEDGRLVGVATVRDSFTSTDPFYSDHYPVDEFDQPYSPWFVTHRCLRCDIGQDENYELEVAWEFDQEQGGVVQLSPVIAVNLAAAANQSGLLPAWDISIGAAYWHVVPMTPDVASCFDPSYYHAVPGTGLPMTIPPPGRHRWRVRCEGGQATAWFDDRELDTITLPGWADGRTHVGAHLIGIHCDPGEVYPPGVPWEGDPAVEPVPVATSPQVTVTTW